MSTTTLSVRETQVLILALQCFKGDPKIDYQKLADAAEMSSPKRAMDAWCRLRKKLGLIGPKGADGAPKAGGGKNKRKAAKEEDDDVKEEEGGGEGGEVTPYSPPKKHGRKKGVQAASAKAADEESYEHEQEM